MNCAKIFVSVLFLLSSSLASSHMCWIERIQISDNAIEVYLRSGYEGAYRSTYNPQNKALKYVTGKPEKSFKLSEGESASLAMSIHDNCTAMAERRDGVFGLTIKSTMCNVHGPEPECITQTEFAVENLE